MKNLKKMLLGMVTMMTLVLCLTAAVHAEDEYMGNVINVKSGFKIVVTTTINVYGDSMKLIYPKEFGNGGVKNPKVTLSNKKIVRADIIDEASADPETCIMITPRKPGKTKITITARANGKQVACKGTITVIKPQRGFSKLKLNGKNYAKNISKNENFSHFPIKTDKERIKLEYKLNPNWKIQSVTRAAFDGSAEENYTNKFKSGTYLPISKDYYYMVTLTYVKYGRPWFAQYIHIGDF